MNKDDMQALEQEIYRLDAERTQQTWSVHSTGPHSNNPKLENLQIVYGVDTECICDTVYKREDADYIVAMPMAVDLIRAQSTRITELEAALNTCWDIIKFMEYSDEPDDETGKRPSEIAYAAIEQALQGGKADD